MAVEGAWCFTQPVLCPLLKYKTVAEDLAHKEHFRAEPFWLPDFVDLFKLGNFLLIKQTTNYTYNIDTVK